MFIRANTELDACAHSASHDLQAPLRTIDGFSQMLLEDQAGNLDAESMRQLQTIRTAAGEMRNLIDDLLSLSRVTRCELRRQPVNLSELAFTVPPAHTKHDPEVCLRRVWRPALLTETDLASGLRPKREIAEY